MPRKHKKPKSIKKIICSTYYTEATLKFLKLNPQAQQREAVAQGRSPSPYRLRYTLKEFLKINFIRIRSNFILKLFKIPEVDHTSVTT
ncbi:MAG: hypothetical protein LBJ00_00960 [Planctomycetaceae bacterium]|nr:hypothetical protein [Planctomycetaceae bacterium]